MTTRKKNTKPRSDAISSRRTTTIFICILSLTVFNFSCQRIANPEIKYKIYDGPYIDKDTGKKQGSIKIYSNAKGSKLQITKYSKDGWSRGISGLKERFLFESTNNIFFINIVPIATSQALTQWKILEYEIDEGLFSSSKKYKEKIPIHGEILQLAIMKLQKYWYNTTFVIKEYRKKYGIK